MGASAKGPVLAPAFFHWPRGRRKRPTTRPGARRRAGPAAAERPNACRWCRVVIVFVLRRVAMRAIEFSAVMRTVAVGIGALALASAGHAAGDKAAYDSAKASAKSTYEAAKARCDALKDNAKDICVAEAKAART